MIYIDFEMVYLCFFVVFWCISVWLLLSSRKKKHILWILDLNDILVHWCHVDEQNIPYDIGKAQRVGNRWYWKRPGVDAFLRRADCEYKNIAVWSTMRGRKIKALLKNVFPEFNLFCLWDRSDCIRVTPHLNRRSKKMHGWVKPLSQIESEWLRNMFDHVIIVDTCPYKMACNLPEHVMIVEPWTPDDTRDISDVIKL